MSTLDDLFKSVLAPVADEIDPAKGAALVGYDDGTVKAALDILNQRLTTAAISVDVPATVAGQKVYTVPGGYPVGLINVYALGTLMSGGDASATDGETVVLSDDNAAMMPLDGRITVKSIQSFAVANAVSLSTLGGTGGADLIGYGSQTVRQAFDAFSQPTGGSKVGFQQVGTSAALRDTLAKLQDFSVTPEDFFLAGEADQTGMIQRAIDAVSTAGGGAVLLYKPLYRAAGLIQKTGVGVGGALKDAVTIKAPDGWNKTSVLETYLFDTYKVTAHTPTDANTPNGCALFNLVIDGNAENFAGTPSALAGYGVRFGAIRMILNNVRIVAAPGIGLHTSLGSITRLTTDWYRTELANGYVHNLNVYGSRNDGWVHDGPGDLYIESADLGVNGFPDTAAYQPTFPSLLEPTRRIGNAVINCATEIGWMHTFGCTQGWDFIGGRPSYGSGTIRIKFGKLIAESGNGGVWMREGAYYQGDILDLHNNFGFAGMEYFRDDGLVLQGHINNVQVDLGANNNAQNIIALVGQFKSIGFLAIDGRTFPSQALVIGGVQNRVLAGDITRMGPPGSVGKPGVLPAVRILASATEWTVNVKVRDCDNIATMDAGAGQPVDSCIVGAFLNSTVDFVGFSALTTTQRRNIKLHNLSGETRSRGYVGVSAPITVNSTAIQTFNIPIAGNIVPNPEEVQLNIQYVSGTMPALTIPPTLNINSSTATNLRVLVQFASATNGVVQLVASVP